MKIEHMLILSVAALMSACACAETDTVDGYTWTYRVSGEEAIIGDGQVASISVLSAGDIVVPKVLGGCLVRSISARSFSNCVNMTSITIPVGVTNIGYLAFANCSSLTNAVIPNSVQKMADGIFYGCSHLRSLTIPAAEKEEQWIVTSWYFDDGDITPSHSTIYPFERFFLIKREYSHYHPIGA